MHFYYRVEELAGLIMLSKGKETYPGKQFLPRVGYAYMCVHVCALMGAHYVQGTKERVGVKKKNEREGWLLGFLLLCEGRRRVQQAWIRSHGIFDDATYMMPCHTCIVFARNLQDPMLSIFGLKIRANTQERSIFQFTAYTNIIRA